MQWLLLQSLRLTISGLGSMTDMTAFPHPTQQQRFIRLYMCATCAPVNFTCINWVTEVLWHAPLVAKVRKSLYRSFLELNAPVSIDLENVIPEDVSSCSHSSTGSINLEDVSCSYFSNQSASQNFSHLECRRSITRLDLPLELYYSIPLVSVLSSTWTIDPESVSTSRNPNGPP